MRRGHLLQRVMQVDPVRGRGWVVRQWRHVLRHIVLFDGSAVLPGGRSRRHDIPELFHTDGLAADMRARMRSALCK